MRWWLHHTVSRSEAMLTLNQPVLRTVNLSKVQQEQQCFTPFSHCASLTLRYTTMYNVVYSESNNINRVINRHLIEIKFLRQSANGIPYRKPRSLISLETKGGGQRLETYMRGSCFKMSRVSLETKLFHISFCLSGRVRKRGVEIVYLGSTTTWYTNSSIQLSLMTKNPFVPTPSPHEFCTRHLTGFPSTT